MKRMKRILCMVAVIVLVLTMTTAVSAATLDFANGAVSVTVTTNSTKTVKTPVDGILHTHTAGTADTIAYSLDAGTSGHTLDTSGFNKTYHSYILTTYKVEGFTDSVSVPLTGSVRILATAPSGGYAVILSYTYGTATWEIEENSKIVDSGYIAEAPKSMSISAVLQ